MLHLSFHPSLAFSNEGGESMAVEQRPSRISVQKKENLLGYLLIMPAIILIVIVSIIPILQTFGYSLQYYNLTDPLNQKFIGFANYIQIFKMAEFYDTLFNTLVFTVGSVGLEMVVGLICAMLMNRAGGKGVTTIRTSVLIPWAIPGIVVAQMFRFIFDGQLGVLNSILRALGIIGSTESFAFLAKPGWAMFAVIIADTWKQFPFVALLLYAGLQIIPEELYEAAKVDGGNVVQRFVKITLPMIKPMILVALIFRTMSALRIFDIVYSMTGGGPANTTNTLLHSAYIYLFKDMNFGLGSTMSTIIFILIMIICMIYIKTLGRDE